MKVDLKIGPQPLLTCQQLSQRNSCDFMLTYKLYTTLNWEEETTNVRVHIIIIIIIINKLQMGWHPVAVTEYTEYT